MRYLRAYRRDVACNVSAYYVAIQYVKTIAILEKHDV